MHFQFHQGRLSVERKIYFKNFIIILFDGQIGGISDII